MSADCQAAISAISQMIVERLLSPDVERFAVHPVISPVDVERLPHG